MSYKLRELDMSLKGEIEKIKNESGCDSAATSFLSMYMWRSVYGNQIVCQDGFYALKVAGEDNTWFFPTGCEDVKKAFIEYGLSLGGFRLLFATEADVNFLNKHFAGKMKATEAPDCSEYLYSVDEYRTLEGSQYRKIRSEFKKVQKEYQIECLDLTQENVPMIEEIMADITELSEKKGEFSTSRDGFDRSIFDDIKANGIDGLIIIQNGEPIAAMAGIYIGCNYSVFFGDHKANYDGLVGYCMHMAANKAGLDIKYINMEEDLGIEGLRAWKNKMRPVKKIEMWEFDQI